MPKKFTKRWSSGVRFDDRPEEELDEFEKARRAAWELHKPSKKVVKRFMQQKQKKVKK